MNCLGYLSTTDFSDAAMLSGAECCACILHSISATCSYGEYAHLAVADCLGLNLSSESLQVAGYLSPACSNCKWRSYDSYVEVQVSGSRL